MMGFLDASDFNALRALAGRWREGWISGRYAIQLDAALDAIDARRRSGPDFLAAFVYGNSIPELREAALVRALVLYGPQANLQVERIGTIGTSSSVRGQFHATVEVRCVNYAAVAPCPDATLGPSPLHSLPRCAP